MQNVIHAKDVQIDDYLFNRSAYGEAYKWVRVVEIKQDENGKIHISTTIWDTVKHPLEGVMVRRL